MSGSYSTHRRMIDLFDGQNIILELPQQAHLPVFLNGALVDLVTREHIRVPGKSAIRSATVRQALIGSEPEGRGQKRRHAGGAATSGGATAAHAAAAEPDGGATESRSTRQRHADGGTAAAHSSAPGSAPE